MSRCRTTTSPGTRDSRSSSTSAVTRIHPRPAGPHGLPLIGRADWNDCLNLNCFSDTPGRILPDDREQTGGVAESVFIGGLFVLAAKEMAAIAEQPATDAEADRCRAAGERHGGAPSTRTVGTAHGSGAPTTISAVRSARRERRGPDLHRAAGDVHHGRYRSGGWAGRRRPGRRPRAAGDPARHHPPAAGILALLPASWARSRPIRRDTRRTPASSATPTRG